MQASHSSDKFRKVTQKYHLSTESKNKIRGWKTNINLGKKCRAEIRDIIYIIINSFASLQSKSLLPPKDNVQLTTEDQQNYKAQAWITLLSVMNWATEEQASSNTCLNHSAFGKALSSAEHFQFGSLEQQQEGWFPSGYRAKKNYKGMSVLRLKYYRGTWTKSSLPAETTASRKHNSVTWSLGLENFIQALTKMQICQLWIRHRRQTQVNQVSNQQPTSQSQEGSQSIAQVTWQESDSLRNSCQLPHNWIHHEY